MGLLFVLFAAAAAVNFFLIIQRYLFFLLVAANERKKERKKKHIFVLDIVTFSHALRGLATRCCLSILPEKSVKADGRLLRETLSGLVI